MVHLRSLKYIKPDTDYPECYPYCIPVIKSLSEMSFDSPVVVFIGENGSGKSTLIEAIACAIDMITINNESVCESKYFSSIKNFSKNLKLCWTAKTKKGFFLRSEDFINYTKKIAAIKSDMLNELDRVKEEYSSSSPLAKSLASLPFKHSLNAIENSYNGDLMNKSHGESFLSFFEARFIPGALYILDEPETPLSAVNQIAFLSMIKEMVNQNCQFIIATHSPILMAFPEATIYSFDEKRIDHIKYSDIESVKLFKSFLNSPEKFLRYL